MVKRNVYAEIAKLFDLKLDEKFKLKGDDIWNFGMFTEAGIKFSDDTDMDSAEHWECDPETEQKLFTGEYGVVSVWQPEVGDVYWFVQNAEGAVRKTVYDNNQTLDALNKKAHNMFRTRDVAESQRARIVKCLFGTDLTVDDSELEPPSQEPPKKGCDCVSECGCNADREGGVHIEP